MGTKRSPLSSSLRKPNSGRFRLWSSRATSVTVCSVTCSSLCS
ncbi:gp19.3 [Klebsiella phage K11]|uniref:Gp19.3 n=1 Tax=Enterobacteria phage K11 TaxID=532077 RepID=B3VD27_BPK11|nr:gp19.3 [Klebsiella phage K11]ACF15882.1 gp19.3 [Klebsiella phage K11]